MHQAAEACVQHCGGEWTPTGIGGQGPGPDCANKSRAEECSEAGGPLIRMLQF